MPIRFAVEHRATHCVVRVDGDPTLAEFVAFIERLGIEARSWPTRRALVDLRAVRTLTTAEHHRAVGQAVCAHLASLERLASVVPADRMTRNSERVAQAGGVNLRVFSSEGDALSWLA
ncbi:STAS/SEC14 domain-containing protein [Ramlibacter sp. PS3R-8]|uniref:STAS/SEC14 domain-containing protein n=1 Tax=Ramlibacter sp. PS3R-8 TaxID=3133437 RepID=UPI0030B3BB81